MFELRTVLRSCLFNFFNKRSQNRFIFETKLPPTNQLHILRRILLLTQVDRGYSLYNTLLFRSSLSMAVIPSPFFPHLLSAGAEQQPSSLHTCQGESTARCKDCAIRLKDVVGRSLCMSLKKMGIYHEGKPLMQNALGNKSSFK